MSGSSTPAVPLARLRGEEPALGRRAQSWAVATWSLGLALSVLDASIANVGLPSIARSLHTMPAASIWIVNGAQVASAITVLPLSALVDSAGYKRIFLVGMLVLTLGSLLCATALNLPELVLGRILQGVANGCVFSGIGAFVRATYPTSRVGDGLSLNSAVVAFCSAAGPGLAAAILAFAAWPWLFSFNVPLGLLCFAVGRRTLVERKGQGHGFDAVSAGLNGIAIGAYIFAIQNFGRPQGGPLALPCLALAAVAWFVFIRRQLASPHPMFGVDLLKIPIVAQSVITMVFCFCAQSMTIVVLPFLLFTRFAKSPGSELALVAWPLGVLLIAPAGARLPDRFSIGKVGAAGMALLTVGLVALIALSQTGDWAAVAAAIGLCGLGFGLFAPPNHRGIVASSPVNRTGAASGLNAAFRLLSQSTGAALVALVFALTARGRATPISIVTALTIAAGLSAVGAGLSLLRRGRPRSAAS